MNELINKSVLLVEDDQNLIFFLEKFLTNKGFSVTCIKNGEEAVRSIKKEKFDLYLIDIGLPVFNGFTVVRRLREYVPEKPVIIITDKISEYNEVESFAVGASLFHKKPINYRLLESQIRSLLRDSAIDESINIGDLYVNVAKKIVKKELKPISLTFNEFNLLVLLLKDPGRIFSREQIQNRVLKDEVDITGGAVDTLISRLRKKMGDYKGRSSIETIYKSGFRLNSEYLGSRNKE